MIDTSKKKKTLLALFLSASLSMTGCSLNGADTQEKTETPPAQTEEDATAQEAEDMPPELTDDDGNNYTVNTNDDGTYTARYGNGDSVTFEENDDGTLAYQSGNHSLLPLMAASYFLWRNNGYQQSRHNRNNYYGGYYGNNHRNNNTSQSSVSSGNTTSKSTGKAVGSHSGFGSAGARSGAS